MFRITLAEAATLAEFSSYNDYQFAGEIARAIAEKGKHSENAFSVACAACFNAGVIEGIRRERAKRRKVCDNPYAQCAIAMLREIKSEKQLLRINRFIQVFWMEEGST